MRDTYVVAFRAGSSGRFVAELVWSLVTENAIDSTFSSFNSAHISSQPSSYTLDDMPPGQRPYSNPDVYKYFRFTSSPGIIHLHTYPDFDTIRNRYPDTKIIIISITENDFPEIAGNCLLKNGFEPLLNAVMAKQYNQFNSNDINFIRNFYFEEFKTPIDADILTSLPTTVKKQLIDSYQKRILGELQISGYLNPVVPEMFTNQVLVVSYNDLCHRGYDFLSRLAAFIDRPLSDTTMLIYNQYMRGRKELLRKHMPWLLDK